jgi:hypothetical protein
MKTGMSATNIVECQFLELRCCHPGEIVGYGAGMSLEDFQARPVQPRQRAPADSTNYDGITSYTPESPQWLTIAVGMSFVTI